MEEELPMLGNNEGQCPKCGSTNIHYTIEDENGAVAILWDQKVGSYYAKLRCKDCGAPFKYFYNLIFTYSKYNYE